MDRLIIMKWRLQGAVRKWEERLLQKKSPGIDGILVTVGLCIIALILCVVMKTSLTTFIQELVGKIQGKAEQVLESGVTL